MRILKSANFDFIGKRKIAFAVSGVALLATLLLLVTRGLNLGVDFAGGTEIQLKFNQDVSAETVRDTMKELGFTKAAVQVFGDPADHEYLVRVERMSLLSPTEHAEIVQAIQGKLGTDVTVSPYDPDKGDAVDILAPRAIPKSELKSLIESAGTRVDEVRETGRGDRHEYTAILEGVSTRLQNQLESKLGKGSVDLRRVEYVGPQVGKQLRTRGFLSLLYASIFILIYLAIRFDFRFAPGAVVALVHDATLTVGFYSLTGLDFNLTSIAAILTVIGYSVNDTVVIYDRIRENLQRYQGRGLPSLINQSVNETLSRTLITSGTTVVSLAGLWFYAQGTIWDFAVAMTFGIVVGTYSSVYVASPLVIWLDRVIGGKGKAQSRKHTAKPASSRAA